jgi:DNA-binding Lrp family transcriptional regulator
MLGMSGEAVVARLEAMLANGVVSRFGVVVKHRAFGYAANAMAVWDIADDAVDQVAERFAREPMVTLCYRRPRRLPAWRYNLFCMVHATGRPQALETIVRLRGLAGPALADQATLFSTHCFKQRGAVFSVAALEGAA